MGTVADDAAFAELDDAGQRNEVRTPGSIIMEADTLSEVVDRIVRVANPERIVLFGSAARGEMGPDSDLDLLVIKSGAFHRGQLTEDLYMELIGVGQAVDVLVATPEDVERFRDSHSIMIAPALKEGRVVYHVA